MDRVEGGIEENQTNREEREAKEDQEEEGHAFGGEGAPEQGEIADREEDCVPEEEVEEGEQENREIGKQFDDET